MAMQPHTNPPPAPADAQADTPASAPSSPGGMASDPINALANEIVTNIKGAPDRFRQQVESVPALKALMDQAQANLVAEVAATIRSYVDNEVSKYTGGMATTRKSTR